MQIFFETVIENNEVSCTVGITDSFFYVLVTTGEKKNGSQWNYK